MLLRTAWRRVAAAVPAASPRRPEAPTRGLRLRGTLTVPLSRRGPFSSSPHLNMPEPPSSARCPDPLTLSLGCTPQIFSGRPSEPLTSPRPPHLSPRRPSEPLRLGLQTFPGRLLPMLVVQPVTFEGDLPFLLNGSALSEPSPLPTTQFEYCPNIHSPPRTLSLSLTSF